MFDLRAKNAKETDILMYGSISEWGRVRCEDFIRSINDAKAKGYEKVNLKINSPGGSIIEGIAIMSQMISQEVIIVGIVEGVAASMASAMLQGCHTRKMVKGTRLMVHQGAGSVWGSANYIRDYADLMDSFNKTLAEIYARKTKKEAKWILENWMAEGKDTWFTAEQALKEGLIDEIVEGNVKPLQKESATLAEMAAHFQQYLDTTKNTMDRDKLIKELGLKAEATDAEILAAITALKTPPAPEKKDKTEDTPPPAPEKKEAAEVAFDPIAMLAKDRGMTDAQIESVKILAKTDMKAAMALIPEKKVEAAGSVSVNDLLKSLKEGASGGSVADDRKGWKLSDWEKKDPTGLLALVKDKPAEYCKLFKAEHGFEPSTDEIQKLLSYN